MIKLIRDFNSKKDKEQEERFLNTNNIDLFFATEKYINEIDQWSLVAVRKLIDKMDEIKQNELIIYYSKWNKVIEEIYHSPYVEVESIEYELNKEFLSLLEKKDIFKIRESIEIMSNEDLNFTILSMLSLFKDEKKILYLVNESINNNTSQKKILNLLVFKYITNIK